MKFAIFANETKPGATRLTDEVIRWLRERNMSAQAIQASSIRKGTLNEDAKRILTDRDLIIVLGGDGTLLNAAYIFRDYDLPLLGINIGNLGFLTSFEQSNLYEGLMRIIGGQYRIEERMTLQVFHERDGVRIGTYTAVNDAVVSKNTLARMFDLEISVNDDVIDRYAADGLILATPTGSTAYSLSAGGPIVEPSMEAILLTPICAHNLFSRPMVVNAQEEIAVRVMQPSSDVTLTIDGQLGIAVHDQDLVKVAMGQRKVRFVRLADRSFYEILREKLSRG